MDKATQRGKILAYCRKYGSITVREAFEILHINSPTKRISELRRSGYDIHAVSEVRTNKDGDTVRFLRYYIKESPQYPDIEVGMKVTFTPGFVPKADWDTDDKEEVTGTIVAIYWDHMIFLTEYGSDWAKQKEAFKFSQIGEEVKIHG